MLALIPSPFSLQESDEAPFILTAATCVVHPEVLQASVQVIIDEVATLTSLRLPTRSVAPSSEHDPATPGIHLEIDEDLRVTVPDLPPTIGLDPSGEAPGDAHTITITAAGIRIVGESAAGCFRGATTLVQIIASGLEGDRSATRVPVPALELLDAPRFAWRGLSLDVVRSFQSPQEVRDIIDVLAFYRCNALHLHLTDDQGWRVEIPGRPNLTVEGARGALGDRPGGHYRLTDLAELVTYAADRFITIIPEIDMPGHVSAVMRSYPELLGEGMEVSEYFSQAYLDPRDDGVRVFVAEVIEQLCRLTPGPYVHIGGDESFGMPDELYQEFIAMTTALVRGRGKQPIAWQEAIRAGFDDGAFIQYWIRLDDADASAEVAVDTLDDTPGDALALPPELQAMLAEMITRSRTDLADARERKVPILLSPASHVYLDRPYAEPSADPAQEAAREALGLKVYPAKTIAESYDWAPEQIVDKEVPIVGIEAAIWSETLVTAEDVQFMLLPRFAGVAERAWAQEAAGWQTHARKLAQQAPVFEAHGWRYFRSSLIEWDPTTP